MLSELLKEHKAVDVSKMRATAFLERQNAIELAKLERVSRGSGWKEVKACPVCGSTNRGFEFQKHSVDIVRCLNCSARYGSKIPANLNDIYKADYVAYSIDDSGEHYNFRRERFGRERVNILERYCGDLSKQHLLDIGCGNGYFLSVAAEKCEHCYGTEPSDELRKFAQGKTGLQNLFSDQSEISDKRFDIITLFDVIEHLPDPVDYMTHMRELLNPGGSILIFTPNFDSFSLAVMRESSSIIDPTEHLVVYTLAGLHYLAKRLAFEIVYEETRGLDIENILAFQDHHSEDRNAFLVRWNDELQTMIDASGCGDYARMMLRKPLHTT